MLKTNASPVFRGHILNAEDLIIRQHILNLMCRFKTSWSNNSLYFEQLPDALIQLKEMERDGLIAIHANSVIVTAKGKPFVRNVCMAFDVFLKRKQPNAQLFSMTV
jgi:oxygen-independent coproporphyrinogen-3 oxidase